MAMTLTPTWSVYRRLDTEENCSWLNLVFVCYEHTVVDEALTVDAASCELVANRVGHYRADMRGAARAEGE